MFKILMTLLILASTVTAQSKWKYVGTSTDETEAYYKGVVAVDKETRFRRAWEMLVEGDAEDMTRVFLALYDCKERRMRYLQLGSKPVPKSAQVWYYQVPDSLGDDVLTAVCGPN